MANRIDYTYFEGFRNIPNLNDEVTLEELDMVIDRLEPKFFIEVFGYEFQKLMLADPTDPIYDPILNGVEFTATDGTVKKWEGINNSIANYVFFYFWKERMPQTGGVGFVNANAENALVVNNVTKPNYAFNMIHDELSILAEYLIVNLDSYPTLDFNNLEKLNDFGF